MRPRVAFWGVVIVLAAGTAIDAPGARARAATRNELVTVGKPLPAHPIAPGFLGLSLEFSTVAAYAGTDPAALNPVFLQLIRNVSPGQRPSIRIGGDSTDWAWWRVPSLRRPPGIRIDLTPGWLAVTHALAAALNPRLLLTTRAWPAPKPAHLSRGSVRAVCRRSSSATSPRSMRRSPGTGPRQA